MLGDIPILAPGGTVGHKHRRHSYGPPELATASGGIVGNTGVGGVNARGAGGTGAGDVGCRWHIVRFGQRQGGWGQPPTRR
jgi:hypothetical protein